MGIVPEERTAVHLAAGEQGDKALSIKMLLGIEGRPVSSRMVG